MRLKTYLVPNVEGLAWSNPSLNSAKKSSRSWYLGTTEQRSQSADITRVLYVEQHVDTIRQKLKGQSDDGEAARHGTTESCIRTESHWLGRLDLKRPKNHSNQRTEACDV